MKLAILGGGGFRVPLVYAALLRDHHESRIDEVVLHDVDARRLQVIAQVLAQLAAGVPDAPRVSTTTVLEVALDGSRFVFSAMRVGGLEGRVADERVALDLGVLGQETTGAGGIAYGLRTVPVALEVADAVARVAPGASVINFTNPAGTVTEAMQQVLGDRVVGICDSPIALVRRAVHAVGLDPARTFADYVGLNHLGWLRGLEHDGVDVLPRLLADDDALATIEEARLFGVDWVRTIGALPNEYVYYYDFTRDAVRVAREATQTRGAFLLEQQRGFFDAATARPQDAHAIWQRARREREETYLADLRGAGETRSETDLAGGGYEGVALAYMAAVLRDERRTMILDVRNSSAVPGLPADAVVEVPCLVDASGVRPLVTRPLGGRQLGLLQQVKEVEQLTIAAARTGDPALALRAFAQHPLVDSVTVARDLLRAYGLDSALPHA